MVSQNTQITSSLFSSIESPIIATVPKNFPLDKFFILRVVAFLACEVFLLFLVGFYGYQWGLQSGLLLHQTSAPSEFSLADPVYPINTPSPTPDALNNSKIALSSTSELKTGYHNVVDNPDMEVFIFADLTEESLSGRLLVENIDYLLKRYPQRIRVWYLHTILGYRDVLATRQVFGVLKCLSDQQAVWANMGQLVIEKGQAKINYQVQDHSKYDQCAQTISQDPLVFEQQTQDSQRLMAKYGILGIPTVIFVNNKNPTEGTKIVGALPLATFQDQVKDIMGE